jgi:hypothetical protein
MNDPEAVTLCEAIEGYIARHRFPLVDRIEVFGSTSSKENPLIGGQIVEVRGVELQFEGLGFTRLMEWKVTAEKRGDGWNIVCSPGVPNCRVTSPHSASGEIRTADEAMNVPEAHGPAAALAAMTEPPPLVC